MLSDPVWHVQWMRDMEQQWRTLLSTAAGAGSDPRGAGLLGEM
jgi:hypothetical protein